MVACASVGMLAVEQGLWWTNFIGVGPVGEGRFWKAHSFFTQQGGKSDECVGEPVRLTDASIK